MLTYHISNMKLVVAHSDVSYLSKPQTQSREVFCFLSSDSTVPNNNSVVLNIAHIIMHVMNSATEVELVALYIVARYIVYIRIILKEIGHEQPPLSLQTDKSMTEVVINGKSQPKKNQSNGHALLLAQTQIVSRIIQNIFTTR